jgi:hypothetical protein
VKKVSAANKLKRLKAYLKKLQKIGELSRVRFFEIAQYK